ncbi:rna-directed dna polymerase from mobile element jockey-like [Limosa lapponica baueri]|uniref:Rna-directed dna polymerase from mobile element jockey-like n=1 Tax=Limosa lapponica baueri TaxID=1758121 RepID=A0A2I0UNY0_LIMLA|nr:rna-directed dna polymerase from mobile element jockey-like [Limosa lapponica baueri]
MASLRGNLVAFYDGVTSLVDKGRPSDIIYLDLCKAFDTIHHYILVCKLERHGFDGWTTWWMVTLKELWSMIRCPSSSHCDMDSGTECTLSKFAKTTKLCHAINMLEERDAIQRDLDSLERWACVNFMKFNKAK